MMSVTLTPTIYAVLGCVAAVGNVVLVFVLMLAGRRIYRGNRKNSDATAVDGQSSLLFHLPNISHNAWKWRSTAVVLSVGVISFGQVYHDSVVDNLLPAVEPWLIQNYGSITAGHSAWSFSVSVRQIGELIGCLMSIVADRYGRKGPLLFSAATVIMGGALCSVVLMVPYGLWPVTAGRFLIGIGAGMSQVVGSALLAEIPPIRSRGLVLGTLTAWACVGELAGMLISLPDLLGTADRWPWAMTAGVVLAPIALLILWFTPESPRFLLLNHRQKDGLQSLRFYQSSKDWDSSIEDIEQEMADDNAQRVWSLREVFSRFSDWNFLSPLIIAAFIEGFVHIDDWIWLSYSTEVFLEAGIKDYYAQYASLLMSIPQAAISILLTFYLESFSRKDLIIIPTLGSAFFASIAIISLGMSRTGAVWSLLVPVMAAADLFTAAIASESVYAVVPELFGQRDRVLGTAIGGACQNLIGGIITMVVLRMFATFGAAMTLVPFVLVNILYSLLVWTRVPETGGKSFLYHIALWTTFALCLFHGITSGIPILTSCFAEARTICVLVAQIAWWLSCATGVFIIVISFSMYALLLPRAVQSTFDELSIAAQRNYSAILPLQERFNCCSVDYKPDLSNPEKIKRYEPVNVNFSCSTRSTLIMSKLVHSDEAWMVLKSQQPQKESCTEVLLSYFPGKTRWTWLLIAAAVPQTAFSWLFFFNCFFIACVWYERLHHAEESSPKTVGLAERRSTEQEHEREECIQNSRMRAMDESTRKLYYNDENDAPSEIEVNQLSIHKLTNNTRKPLQRSLRRKPMKEPEQEQQTDLRNKAMSDSYNSTTESEASPSKPSTAANKPILRFTEPTKLLRQHSLPESIEDSRVHADDISEENRRLLSGPRRESSIAMVSSYRKKLPHYRLRLTPDESMSVVTEEARTPTSPLPPSPSATTNDVLETDETSV